MDGGELGSCQNHRISGNLQQENYPKSRSKHDWSYQALLYHDNYFVDTSVLLISQVTFTQSSVALSLSSLRANEVPLLNFCQ